MFTFSDLRHIFHILTFSTKKERKRKRKEKKGVGVGVGRVKKERKSMCSLPLKLMPIFLDVICLSVVKS